MLNRFDPKSCRAITDDIQAAIKAVADKHGITLTVGRGTYSAETFSFKISATVRAADGSERTREAIDFERYSRMYGLPTDSLGKKITLGRKTFTIAGLRTKARSKPIVIVDESGKSFITTAEEVRTALGVEPRAALPITKTIEVK